MGEPSVLQSADRVQHIELSPGYVPDLPRADLSGRLGIEPAVNVFRPLTREAPYHVIHYNGYRYMATRNCYTRDGFLSPP